MTPLTVWHLSTENDFLILFPNEQCLQIKSIFKPFFFFLVAIPPISFFKD